MKSCLFGEFKEFGEVRKEIVGLWEKCRKKNKIEWDVLIGELDRIEKSGGGFFNGISVIGCGEIFKVWFECSGVWDYKNKKEKVKYEIF